VASRQVREPGAISNCSPPPNFNLSENVLPKIQNSGLKIYDFGKFSGKIKLLSTHDQCKNMCKNLAKNCNFLSTPSLSIFMYPMMLLHMVIQLQNTPNIFTK